MNETLLCYISASATDVQSTSVGYTTSIPTFVRSNDSPALDPVSLALPPVIAAIVISTCAWVGFFMIRQLRKRRSKKTIDDQCVNRHNQYRQRNGFVIKESTTRCSTVMNPPQTQTSRYRASPLSSPRYRIASAFSPATRCGVVAAAANPDISLQPTKHAYRHEKQARGNSLANDRTDHRSSGLCTVSETVSHLYTISDDAMSYVNGEISDGTEEKQSDHNLSVIYRIMEDVGHQGRQVADESEQL